MSGKRGNYSNIIIYDEKRRYYYLAAQKNKPLLDDEVRALGITALDQTRRAVQHIYGDVASPNSEYSVVSPTSEAFKITESSTDKVKNFTVVGGGSLDHPAVLYAKGFYIFITGDMEYKEQRYTTENVDLNTISDKYKTLTPIPALTTPTTDRIDIVYLSLKFEEVTAAPGVDPDVYFDSGLKNPIVGTETANRLRAVFDVLVKEGWSSPVGKDIFNSPDFLGGISPDDSNPLDNVYKIPVAAIYRKAFQDVINEDEIVDLLTLYNKRVFSLEEISYRMLHGGYTEQDVLEKGLTGFNAQFPFAVVDEGAFATGLNEGLGSEAFNSNSVTPRIVDSTGNFFINGLMVGHDTGLVSYETGAVDLQDGEIIAQKQSVRNLYVGHGITGIPEAREYKDTVNIVARGETGVSAFEVTNYDGETGSQTAHIHAINQGQQQNFFYMDYKGRVGLNKFNPGWESPDAYWNANRYNDGLFGETGVNIILDVDGSARVKDHLYVGKDAYVERDLFGRTWKIPERLSTQEPALFGFTGIPQEAGFTGAVSTVIFKTGVAAVGETGLTGGHGYTGASFGQFESYDAEGNRLFTIGDLGDDYDRVVMTLYGTGTRFAYKSDFSFLKLPSGYDEVLAGDTISYDILLVGGIHVTGTVVLTVGGMPGVEEIRDDIINNPGFPNTYQRSFPYTYYNTNGTTETRIGEDFGSFIVEDPFGFSLGYDEHGRIVIKDIPEDPVNVELDTIVSFTVSRVANPSVSVTFTSFHFEGSGGYGGVLRDIKFAKLDLGEGAEAWLFNGDVYFNGNGKSNRVVFSPNVTFRDDVFVYGTFFADQVVYNAATTHNLNIRNNLTVGNAAEITNYLAVGKDSLSNLLNINDMQFFVKGNGMMYSLTLSTLDTTNDTFGDLYFRTPTYPGAYVRIGGSVTDPTNPFGIHIVDNRPGVDLDSESSFKDLALDYSDGNGNIGNINLIINGDITLNRGLVSKYLACGDVTEINTDYAFYCNGRAQINDVLEVKALRFIGAEAPEGSTDIQTPANVVVIDNNTEETHNNENILRTKKYTVTERIYLNNKRGSDTRLGYSGTALEQDYYDNIRSSATTVDPRGTFAYDSLSYSEEDFDVLSTDPGNTTGNEIVVQEVTNDAYKRYSFRRAIVATLGTLNIEWTGYAYDPTDTISGSVIQRYFFVSPYFRNRNGGTIIDWLPGSERFGDDNLIVKVNGSIIDDNTSSPEIFTLEKTLQLYVPREQWYQADAAPIAGKEDYRSFMLFYPYENVINNRNFLIFDKQLSGEFDSEWQIAVYPRLIKQQRLPFDQSAGSNQERMYQGEWDLDLVIFPPQIGRCANMVGDLYISYMQS